MSVHDAQSHMRPISPRNPEASPADNEGMSMNWTEDASRDSLAGLGLSMTHRGTDLELPSLNSYVSSTNGRGSGLFGPELTQQANDFKLSKGLNSGSHDSLGSYNGIWGEKSNQPMMRTNSSSAMLGSLRVQSNDVVMGGAGAGMDLDLGMRMGVGMGMGMGMGMNISDLGLGLGSGTDLNSSLNSGMDIGKGTKSNSCDDISRQSRSASIGLSPYSPDAMRMANLSLGLDSLGMNVDMCDSLLGGELGAMLTENTEMLSPSGLGMIHSASADFDFFKAGVPRGGAESKSPAAMRASQSVDDLSLQGAAGDSMRRKRRSIESGKAFGIGALEEVLRHVGVNANNSGSTGTTITLKDHISKQANSREREALRSAVNVTVQEEKPVETSRIQSSAGGSPDSTDCGPSSKKRRSIQGEDSDHQLTDQEEEIDMNKDRDGDGDAEADADADAGTESESGARKNKEADKPPLPTNIETLKVKALPDHWRCNKSLPTTLTLLSSKDIPDGTKVEVKAEIQQGTFGELKNSTTTFKENEAKFKDFRFVGRSGRGHSFTVTFHIKSDPPVTAILTQKVKITVDGPRPPRTRRLSETHKKGAYSDSEGRLGYRCPPYQRTGSIGNLRSPHMVRSRNPMGGHPHMGVRRYYSGQMHEMPVRDRTMLGQNPNYVPPPHSQPPPGRFSNPNIYNLQHYPPGGVSYAELPNGGHMGPQPLMNGMSNDMIPELDSPGHRTVVDGMPVLQGFKLTNIIPSEGVEGQTVVAELHVHKALVKRFGWPNMLFCLAFGNSTPQFDNLDVTNSGTLYCHFKVPPMSTSVIQTAALVKIDDKVYSCDSPLLFTNKQPIRRQQPTEAYSPAALGKIMLEVHRELQSYRDPTFRKSEAAFHSLQLNIFKLEGQLLELSRRCLAHLGSLEYLPTIDNAEQAGITILHLSGEFGWDKFIHLLLEAGADMSQCDAQGRTVMDWARRNDRQSTVQYLTWRASQHGSYPPSQDSIQGIVPPTMPGHPIAGPRVPPIRFERPLSSNQQPMLRAPERPQSTIMGGLFNPFNR